MIRKGLSGRGGGKEGWRRWREGVGVRMGQVRRWKRVGRGRGVFWEGRVKREKKDERRVWGETKRKVCLLR